MKSLKNLTGDSLEQLIDYNVVDQHGDEIGTLHSLWSDPDTGAVEFLGVKTGWLFGQNHVVPAGKAELDEATNVVCLPYTEAFIKEAPSMSADAEISEAEENDIYKYYGMNRGDDAVAGATATAATDSYSGMGTPAVAEAAGASALARASEAGDGASQSGAPDAGAASRWKRTSRPGDVGLDPAASSAGESVRAALDDLSPSDSSGSRQAMTPASPGAYGTANLYGSTGTGSPVSADALGTPLDSDEAKYGGGTGATGITGTGSREAGGANLDPITGEPGAHPVGTGVGALGAGAAGAAIGGMVGGPVGAPVGAVIGTIVGAVGGGLAGKGVAESIHPTEEDAYWQSNFRNASYFQNDYEYSDYAPAYKTGSEGYGKYARSGRDYTDAEPDLQRDYEAAKGSSRLEWEKAKSATRDAWERLKAKASDAQK